MGCAFIFQGENTPLNPLLIEGTSVGWFWVRGVKKVEGVVFGNNSGFCGDLGKSPLERGGSRRLARDGVCDLNFRQNLMRDSYE